MSTTTAIPVERRGAYQTPLLLLSAAAVALASHALPASLAALRSTLLFVGLGGVLATTTKYWLDKRSSRFALALVALVLVAAAVGRVPVPAYEGFVRYQATVELLVGVGLLRKVSARTQLDGALAACTARVSPRLRTPLLCLLSCALAAPLSVGAVAVLCASLGKVLAPKTTTAVVAMRTLGATMFVLPTTAGAAIVSASLPGLARAEVMRFGMPLFLVVVVSCCLRGPLEVLGHDPAPRGGARATLWPLGLFWLLVGLFLTVTPAHGTTAVALAAFITFFAEAAREQRPGSQVVDDVQDALRGATGELVLLFACGVLTAFLARAPLPQGLQHALRYPLQSRAAVAALALFLLPLTSIVGAHPVVLFSLAFPLLDRRVLGGGAREYVLWVSMFALAQLISPTSTSARLAAASLGISPQRASFGSHALFAGALALGIWAYVVFG